MPGKDLVNLVQQLSQRWGPHEENTALLLETLTAQVDWAWADRTVDPDDPEVKAARERMRKVKPPQHPILRPIALRPAEQTERRWEEYVQQINEMAPPKEDEFALLQKWKQQHGIA